MRNADASAQPCHVFALEHILDQAIGLQNVLMVLTADHGISPVPEVLKSEKMPGWRLPNTSITGPMEKALVDRFGAGKWLLSTAGPSPYFNWPLMRAQRLDPREVERVAADAVAQLPHVSRVFTRYQMLNGLVPFDKRSQRVLRGFDQAFADGFVMVMLAGHLADIGAVTRARKS